MNYGKLVDMLADEERTLLKRVALEEAREEKLAALARAIEDEEETPESSARLDRVSDLTNRQIKKADDLQWRADELKSARYKIEEILELRDSQVCRLARARRQRAQKAV